MNERDMTDMANEHPFTCGLPSGEEEKMIPVKLFQKMLDLEAEFTINRSFENLRTTTEYQDAIKWPYGASKEQLEFYENWYKNIDPPIICDGCRVMFPFEHRCHRANIRLLGEKTKFICQCKECRE